MDESSHFATLDLIFGPMFGGKTSELIRRLNIFSAMGLRCIYINSDKDNRSTQNFSTHNTTITSIGNIDSIKIPQDITSIIELHQKYDVFGIDEGQLFTNLLSTCTDLVEHRNKKVIVASLNGDSERRPFGDIIYLIPLCDDIQKLYPYCQLCARQQKLSRAMFTKCLCEKTDTVLIGNHDTYMPVCRKCYLDPISYKMLPAPPASCTTSGSSSGSSSDSSSGSSPGAEHEQNIPLLTNQHLLHYHSTPDHDLQSPHSP